MSRISGLYQFDGRPVERLDLCRITQTLAGHGPDGSAVWAGGCVGLGHCGSHFVSPLPSGLGVLVSQDSQLALAADARIDNREQLIDQFGWHRHPTASEISDSRLILGAYDRWGEDCCQHLLGDFAFALWDGRRQQLFCGRDHLGVRPFYYATSGTSFAFSSEIKALFSLDWMPRRVNETRVADYLMQMYQDKESTFYLGIRRLPPAHTLTVSPDGVRLRQYWDIDPDREVRYPSDDEYAEAYRELFTEAVRCQSRSIHPVGAFLSGGLDSSSVTCVARSLLEAEGKQPMATFSLIFDEERQCDERPYIDAVLTQGGLRPHYVQGDGINPFDCLDQMLQEVEEPFFTPNLFLYWHLYSAAQSNGVRVVLDGLFGDNIVSHGSRYLTELAATGRWLKLAREVNTTARVLGSRRRHSRHLVQQFILTPLVAEPLQQAWQTLTKPELPPNAAGRFINRSFLRDIGWMERAGTYEEPPRTPRSVREEHAKELRAGALPGVLEITNKAAAAFGVTPCFPFTDRRLVEFCLAIPATQKYHEGWTRVIARRGMRQYLPEKVYQRYGKTYLERILYRSLFVLGKEQADSLILDRLPIAAPYVDVASLQLAYRRMTQSDERGEHLGHGETTLAIWYALILTRWLELETKESCSRNNQTPNVVESPHII